MATGDAKIKRQVAAECRMRHGMTVIVDDTTEYESQDKGLAKMAVREVKDVARSVRIALGEFYKKDIGFEAPGVALARLPRAGRTGLMG